MTTRGIPLLGIAASAVLVVVASTLVWLLQTHDDNNYSSAAQVAVMVQLQDADWNVELARARDTSLANLDTLTEIARRTTQLQSTVRDILEGNLQLPNDLRQTTQLLIDAIESKKEHIETFKTQYSALSNVNRYLHFTALDLAGDPNLTAPILREVLALNAMIQHHYVDHDPGTPKDIEASLSGLESESTTLSGPTAGQLENFVTQSGARLRYQQAMEVAYSQATTGGVKSLSGQVAHGLKELKEHREDVNSWYRNALVATTTALVLIWSVLVPKTKRGTAQPPAKEAQAPMTIAWAEVTLASQGALMEVVAQGLAQKAKSISKLVDSLSVVRNYARSEATRKARTLAAISSNAREMGDFAEKMVEYAANRAYRKSTFEHFNIGTCIERAIVDSGVQSVATLKVELAETPPLLASSSEVCAILTDLLKNAAQAVQGVKHKGVIAIATEYAEEKLTVAIDDNGIGMTTSEVERAYAPFYSTSGERSGVGLTTTRHLIASQGGSMSINSIRERGTSVRISFPGSKKV